MRTLRPRRDVYSRSHSKSYCQNLNPGLMVLNWEVGKSNGWGGERERDKGGEKPPVNAGFFHSPLKSAPEWVPRSNSEWGEDHYLHICGPQWFQMSLDEGFSTPGAAIKRGKKKLHVIDHECWYLRKFLSKVKKEVQVSGVILRRTFGHL